MTIAPSSYSFRISEPKSSKAPILAHTAHSSTLGRRARSGDSEHELGAELNDAGGGAAHAAADGAKCLGPELRSTVATSGL